MSARIQIRRDLALNWFTNNPILTEGELGYETDTGKLKIGDGVQLWRNLEYFQETTNNVTSVAVPSTPTSAGAAGTISYDNNYLYVCISNNSWQRIEWSTSTWTT